MRQRITRQRCRVRIETLSNRCNIEPNRRITRQRCRVRIETRKST